MPVAPGGNRNQLEMLISVHVTVWDQCPVLQAEALNLMCARIQSLVACTFGDQLTQLRIAGTVI